MKAECTRVEQSSPTTNFASCFGSSFVLLLFAACQPVITENDSLGLGDDADGESCSPGTKDCSCAADQSCNDGLQCIAGRCLEVAEGSGEGSGKVPSSGRTKNGNDPGDKPPGADSRDEDPSEDEIDDGYEEEWDDWGHCDFPSIPDGYDGGHRPMAPSQLWVTSQTGAVLKIDSALLQVTGSYRGGPSPDEYAQVVSVNLWGDAAVANLQGGVTKIIGDAEDCSDRNGSGKIETSQSFVPRTFGTDECVAWYVETSTTGKQRILAWNGEEQLWVGGHRKGYEEVEIALLDGESGDALTQYKVDFADLGAPVGDQFSTVDANGSLWFTGIDPGVLVMVNPYDDEPWVWKKEHPSYGLAVDSRNRIWTCGSMIARFNPTTAHWDQISGEYGSSAIKAGVDGDCSFESGRIWQSVELTGGGGAGVVAIDVESMEVASIVKAPIQSQTITFDEDGWLWLVPKGERRVFRIDPNDQSFETLEGFDPLDTYGDLTGTQLRSLFVVE